MRKDALTICLITIVAGIFGAFFRWLQLLNAFEPLTGLVKPFAATSIILVIYSLLAAALFAAIVLLWLKRYHRSTELETAFATRTKLPMLIVCAAGALLAVLSVAWLMLANHQRYVSLHRILAVGGILTGLSLFFMGCGKFPEEQKTLSLVPILFCCLWLAVCYKDNAEDPVIWNYVLEILAISSTTIAYYELSAYRYNRAKPDLALFFLLLSAYLNMSTLFDERGLVMQLFFIINAVIMLLMEYLLMANMREGRDWDTEEEQA